MRIALIPARAVRRGRAPSLALRILIHQRRLAVPPAPSSRHCMNSRARFRFRDTPRPHISGGAIHPAYAPYFQAGPAALMRPIEDKLKRIAITSRAAANHRRAERGRRVFIGLGFGLIRQASHGRDWAQPREPSVPRRRCLAQAASRASPRADSPDLTALGRAAPGAV